MRLENEPESTHVENRRGRGGGLGGGGGLPVQLGHLSFGTIVLLVIFAILFRINPLDLITGAPSVAPPTQQTSEVRPEDSFVKKVLHSTEDVWGRLLAEKKVPGAPDVYPPPTLVLFDGAVQSGCGGASAAMGPFYCPTDQKLYLDTAFFNELAKRFGAPGDFAQAYVIAHEVGHHIQKLTGVADKADQARASLGKTGFNKFSVKMELQADCYAGIWGHYAAEWKNQLDPDDIDEALKAANAIGDDTLQKAGRGYVVPDSFTHGTSAQRTAWFKRGFDSGEVAQCDTFNAPDL
jgi:predicted metalloprotease